MIKMQNWRVCVPDGDARIGFQYGARRRKSSMDKIGLVAELTDICIRQAEIIKAQAYTLEQFGAQVREEEAIAERTRLREVSWRLGKYGRV